MESLPVDSLLTPALLHPYPVKSHFFVLFVVCCFLSSASHHKRTAGEMPSRKKAKGKARKAAKAKKEAEEGAEGREDEMSPLQARMAQLSIGNNEDARLMEQLWIMKNPGNNQCTHGSTPLDQRAKKFFLDFMTLYQRNICSSRNGKYDVGKELATVHEVTREMYSDV